MTLDVKVIENEYIYIKPVGVFNAAMLEKLFQKINEIEKQNPNIRKRLNDSRFVTGIDVSFGDLLKYKDSREKIIIPGKKQMAFWVDSKIKLGFARMCEMLLEPLNYEVREFSDLEELCSWLDIEEKSVPQ